MRFWDTILSFLFPVKCVLCGREGASACAACLGAVPAAERESASWIFPVCDYRDPGLRKALRLFKYEGRRGLAAPFAEILYGKIVEELADLGTMENFAAPGLIPVPLSRRRKLERGYNQAELLCVEIMRLSAFRTGPRFQLIRDALIRTRDTGHQARIKSRTERLTNIRGAFTVRNEESIRGKNIILIDDILTTGATLTEARKILRNAGARKVIAFTVAH